MKFWITLLGLIWVTVSVLILFNAYIAIKERLAKPFARWGKTETSLLRMYLLFAFFWPAALFTSRGRERLIALLEPLRD